MSGIDPRPRRLAGCQRLEFSGNLAFGPVEPCEENATTPIEIIGENYAFLQFEAERRLDKLRRDLEQLPREQHEPIDRQAAVPLVHRVGKRIGNTGAHAYQCRLLDAEPCRNLVGGDKADAANVAGEAIGVLRDQPDGIGAVGPVDPHGARSANAMAVEEEHDLANDLLLAPAGDDAFRALRADPGHLAQPAWLLFDDLEHRLAKGANQFFGVDRPDAADHPRAEIFLDPFCRRWGYGLQE